MHDDESRNLQYKIYIRDSKEKRETVGRDVVWCGVAESIERSREKRRGEKREREEEERAIWLDEYDTRENNKQRNNS